MLFVQHRGETRLSSEHERSGEFFQKYNDYPIAFYARILYPAGLLGAGVVLPFELSGKDTAAGN